MLLGKDKIVMMMMMMMMMILIMGAISLQRIR